MTQAELIARRQGADSQAERKAAEAARRGNTQSPSVECVHRSFAPVGKIRCNCSNQPEVFGCDDPWVTSGFCTPDLPVKPGDGPILLADGSRLTPADDRMQSFIPWPIRDGDHPKPWDVIICSTCPNRVDPPPHIANLRRLGIGGNYDPTTGYCDVLHTVPNQEHWTQHAMDYVASSPDSLRSCLCSAARKDVLALVEATQCKLLVSHTGDIEAKSLIAFAEANPHIKVWSVLHGSQNSMCHNIKYAQHQAEILKASARLENLWYGTPELTADFTAFGYSRYLHWPNPMPFESPQKPPTIHETPVLLISARDDIIKGNSAKVLAAGLIAKQRPVKVHTAIKGQVSALQQVAAAVGIPLEIQPIRTQVKFREYIREHVSVTLSSSLTDADQYVGRDSLSQGRPVVGSQTIRYLPKEWQADPNDPADIARVAMMMLDDYDWYSAESLRLAKEISEQQKAAYGKAIERILS
jgi:hypothetical protein